MIILCVVVFLILALIILTKTIRQSPNTVSGVDNFDLTKEEIIVLELEAKKGKLVAIKRLRDYCSFVLLDDSQTVFWAKKAAELGDEDSKKMVEYFEKNRNIK